MRDDCVRLLRRGRKYVSPHAARRTPAVGVQLPKVNTPSPLPLLSPSLPLLSASLARHTVAAPTSATYHSDGMMPDPLPASIIHVACPPSSWPASWSRLESQGCLLFPSTTTLLPTRLRLLAFVKRRRETQPLASPAGHGCLR